MIWKLLFAVALLGPAPAFSQTLEAYVESQSRYRIRDLKPVIHEIPYDSTCLHDYLAWRDRLAFKLKLSPATIVGYEGGGFLAGAGLGRLLIASGAAVGEMADLAALVAGLGFGIIAGTGASVGSVTSNIIKISHVNRLMKIIYDSRTGGGWYLHQFYEDHRSEWKDRVTEASIASEIARLDSTRKLCDGTYGRSGFFVDEKKLKNHLLRSPKKLAGALAGRESADGSSSALEFSPSL